MDSRSSSISGGATTLGLYSLPWTVSAGTHCTRSTGSPAKGLTSCNSRRMALMNSTWPARSSGIPLARSTRKELTKLCACSSSTDFPLGVPRPGGPALVSFLLVTQNGDHVSGEREAGRLGVTVRPLPDLAVAVAAVEVDRFH